MQTPGEEALVERACRGDPAAFEELVLAYQSLAFRTAFVIAGDAADAEEAAQDGFVKAHRALGRFRLGEPFRPWLLAIVANEARNRRRSRGRRAALALRAAPSPERPARIRRKPRSAASVGSSSWPPSRGCATTTATCSPAATSSSSRSRKRPPRWGSLAGP
jgi:RNA polymerase sigma factor (sigma-70 family)